MADGKLKKLSLVPIIILNKRYKCLSSILLTSFSLRNLKYSNIRDTLIILYRDTYIVPKYVHAIYNMCD